MSRLHIAVIVVLIVVLIVLMLLSALGSWVNERCPRHELSPAWQDRCIEHLADEVLS